MMKKAIILHGTLGSPEGNWFCWLEAELKKRGFKVWLPQLPHAEQPSLSEFSDYVLSNAPFDLDKDTLLIGHSSGAVAGAVVLQKLPNPIKAFVGVAIFKSNDIKWEPNNKLFDVDFNLSAMTKKAGKILLIHSDNDPYCPLDHAKYFADGTGAELVVIPGQGHFNLEASKNYKAFPKLIKLLEERSLV